GVAVRGGTGAEAGAVRVADGPVGLGPPLLLPVAQAAPELDGLAVAGAVARVVQAHPGPGADRRVPGLRPGRHSGPGRRPGEPGPGRHGRGDPPRSDFPPGHHGSIAIDDAE